MRLGIENLESRQLLSGAVTDSSSSGSGTNPAVYSGTSGGSSGGSSSGSYSGGSSGGSSSSSSGGSASGSGSGSGSSASSMSDVAGLFAAGDLGYYDPPEVFYHRDVARIGTAWQVWQPSSPSNSQFNTTSTDAMGGISTYATGSTWTAAGNPYSSSSSSGGSSGGGAVGWSQAYTSHVDSTYHRSGTDSAGVGVVRDAARTYDLTWQAGSSDGVTVNYKVTIDVTYTDSTALADPNGAANRGNKGDSFNYHLVSTTQTVGGTVAASAYTFKGDGENHDKIHLESGTDGQGHPAGSSGMVLDIALASTFTIDEQGGQGPGASFRSQEIDTKTAHDNYTTWDGGVGNLIASTANEDDYNEDDYNHAPAAGAAPSSSSPTDPSAPTTAAAGPASGAGTSRPFPLTLSGHVVYIIDSDDKGWEDYGDTPAEIVIAHPFTGGPMPATGQDFYNTLKPTGPFIKAKNVTQIVADAATRAAAKKADFLIIADHGGPINGQSVGLPPLTSNSLSPSEQYINENTDPKVIDSLLSDLAPGGWLVLTGCDVGDNLDFKKLLWTEAIKFPQIGGVYVSNSPVSWPPGAGTPTGDWQPITPGGPMPGQ